MGEQIWRLDACEIADGVRSGELSASEVLETCVQRIRDHDGALNAFVHLDVQRAAADAREIDRRVRAGDDPGPLAGVPVGVKDLEDVAGMPTRLGSIPYRDHVAAADGIQVARLRAAGCVLVGKTATPEFGTVPFTSSPLHGHTRSPWNPERTPGGSSGGSAAAVMAGMVPIGTGSDGGGSIRIPASYTGMVGLKGTYGRIPRGSGPDSSYTSHLGPMARSVRDAARFFDATMGPHERDQFALPHPGMSYEQAIDQPPPRGLRAVWSEDLGYGRCARQVVAIARRAADTLAGRAGIGWIDRAVELPDTGATWGVLGQPARWLQVEKFWPDREEDFTPIVRFGVRSALERYNVQEAARATEQRFELNRILAEVFEEVDLIITPTTSTAAFAAEGPMPTEIDGEPISPMHSITFTYPFNISGHPAISIPAGLDDDGMPVGLQLVARRHADHVLLQLGRVLEQTSPWPKLAPGYE